MINSQIWLISSGTPLHVVAGVPVRKPQKANLPGLQGRSGKEPQAWRTRSVHLPPNRLPLSILAQLRLKVRVVNVG